jgi:hypothetical protein
MGGSAPGEDSNGPTPLSAEPVAEQSGPAGGIGGSLELVDADKISGWAWNRADPSTRVAVEVYVDGVYSGWARADKHRADLTDAGIGDGRHAYLIRSPDVLRSGRPHSVTVKVAGADADLWGSPKSVP